MKITTNKQATEIQIKDGKRIVARVATTLDADTLEGLIAGLDIPEDATPESLVAAIEAAIENLAKRVGSVIPDDYRVRYGVHQNCGDDIAETLRNLATDEKGQADMAKLEAIAADNGVADKFDGWLVKGLNNGMVRMNLGNVLRGKARRGEEVILR